MTKRVACVIFGFLAAVACVAGPASSVQALTLKNLDSESRAVTVTENDKKTKLQLKPSETLGNVCSSACVIETPDGYVYDFDGGESVVIQDGALDIADDENSSGK